MLYTDNYSLKKPQYGETADVADINYNADKIDGIMWDNRRISVAMYDTSETYNTDALVGHEDSNGHIHVYKCLADNVTGTWDNTKWEMTDLASEIEDVRENAGTDVEANPSGTATETLEKLRVDSTIYAIPKDVVSKEAEGNPIEITDGASAPLVKCVTAITGSQDLHGYDKPWVGGAGKNKLPNEITTTTERDVTFITQANGKIKVSGTASGSIYQTDICENFSLPIGSYILSYDAMQNCNIQICNRDEIREYCSVNYNTPSVTFVVNETNKDDMRVRFIIKSDNTVNGETGIMIRLASVTDPTFEPYSNICPISGYDEVEIEGCGKNLVLKTIRGYFNESTGLVKIDGNSNSVLFYANRGITYILSSSVTPAVADRNLVGKVDTTDIVNNTPISNVGYAQSNDTWTATFTGWALWYKCSSLSTEFEDSVQVEIGTSATAYEPYKSNSYTISLGSTRYGGTLDVVRGVLRVTHGYVDLGSLEWTYYAYAGKQGGYTAGLNTLIKKPTSGTSLIDAISSGLAQVADDNFNSSNYGSFTVNTYGNMKVLMEGVSSDATLKTALDGIYLCYELSTPLTISLTPTQVRSLLGNNYLSCSTGDMEIEYITGKYQPLVNLMKTMVVANPSEDATATLEKLKVNDTVYSLPSGGGGGGESVRASNTITVSGGVS